MKKIIATIFILFLCLTLVSAVPADNWFGRIISNLKYANTNLGPFTVYGDELGCSVTADRIGTFKAPSSYGWQVPTGKTAFVNWFRGSPNDGAYPDHPTVSRQFIREDFLWSLDQPAYYKCDSGAYWNNDCYGEIYYCEKPVCYSNLDCSSGETCRKEVLSLKIPDAGVCKASTPTHTTQVYRCENNVKTSMGRVSYGNLAFCTDPSKTRYYLTAENTDSCLSYVPDACKSSTSEPEPEEPEEEITNPVCGDNVCNGNELCDTCAEDCGECSIVDESSLCNTESDLDCDGQISQAERDSYISKWKNDEITRDDLGIVLEAWAEQ
jgi:hypothetical protein